MPAAPKIAGAGSAAKARVERIDRDPSRSLMVTIVGEGRAGSRLEVVRKLSNLRRKGLRIGV